jgi:hypothetical protein
VATVLVGAFSVRFLDLDWLHGLLLGAAIASTDVAAVFTVLRSRNVGLQGRIRPLLELESALNDPMTVFLSVGLLQQTRILRTASWGRCPNAMRGRPCARERSTPLPFATSKRICDQAIPQSWMPSSGKCLSVKTIPKTA